MMPIIRTCSGSQIEHEVGDGAMPPMLDLGRGFFNSLTSRRTTGATACVVDIAGRQFKGEQFAGMMDGHMQLESEEPAGGGLAKRASCRGRPSTLKT